MFTDRHHTDDPPATGACRECGVLGGQHGRNCSTAEPRSPYPMFCHTPAECAGLGSCPRDIACNH